MIERRVAKKVAREEDLNYVELDIERLEAHGREGEATVGGLLSGQPD